MKKEKVKIVGYVRVSTKLDAQDSSYKNQQQYFGDNIKDDERYEYELIEVYKDKESGTKFNNREDFNRMLKDAGLELQQLSYNTGETRKKYIEYHYVINPSVKPKFKYIYVKSSSRFARNTEVKQILRVLKQNGVYVRFMDIGKSTEDETESMMLDMLFTVDAQESRNISQRIKTGNKVTAKNGKIRVGHGVYGYDVDTVNNKCIAIKEEAEVINLMYNLRLEGSGARVISNELAERKIYNRDGKKFNKEHILRILRNKMYCGYIVRNKTESDFDTKTREKVSEDNIIEIKSDSVDVIIDEEKYDRVQDIMNSTAAHDRAKKNKFENKGKSKYAGKIRCSVCGGLYTKCSSKNYHFYVCYNKKHKSACNSVNVKMETLDMNTAFERIFIKDKTLDINNSELKIKAKEIKENIKKHYSNDNNIEEINKLIEKEKENQRMFLELFKEKAINKEVLLEESEKINNRIEELKANLINDIEVNKIIEEESNNIDRIINSIENYCNTIPEEMTDEEYLNKYLEYIEVIDKKELIYHNKIDSLIKEFDEKYERYCGE